MINTTNVLGKDNPRWPNGNAAETIKVASAGGWVSRAPTPVQRGPVLRDTWTWDRPPLAIGDTLRIATSSFAGWLAGIPRWAGARLFAKNDLEARWRGWQVTVLAGGLVRQYRDPAFDTLRDRLDQHGGLVEPDPNAGTQTATPSPCIPGVPEAWDDHWNGRPPNGEG